MMTTVFERVRVGPYEIVHEIGRGGMAVVFFATDRRNDRPVALKLVPAGTDRDAQEIVEAERWGAKLQEQFCQVSQNVPVLYEYGTEGGYFYIAMEYLEGRNLSEILGAGALSPKRATGIAIQLCRFLEAAHGFESTIDGRHLRSLLHGDLKPRNIRLLWLDKVKILDFGIAKALSLSRKVTRNDFGSINYVSPEWLESGEVDTYADFWAVGVLLYEMLAGVQPFQAPDTRRLERRIRSLEPPEPLGAPCPPPLQAVVAKLLAARPADRYGDARTIREDLECALLGRATQAEREGWPAHSVRHDQPPTMRTQPSPRVDEDATRKNGAGRFAGGSNRPLADERHFSAIRVTADVGTPSAGASICASRMPGAGVLHHRSRGDDRVPRRAAEGRSAGGRTRRRRRRLGEIPRASLH